jgi:hypothetical protein
MRIKNELTKARDLIGILSENVQKIRKEVAKNGYTMSYYWYYRFCR